ncbi:MAG: SDR family NAD(P)-dependent oxidoreductase [Candidatus Krumholzibacteria bacterium]|nr:SDR family NAD(P)-dependent oxidoreductase [Candidatus Krumholzibacteria bacterium]
MNRIEGKRVLVTGASAGIGEACARAFAARGARLVLWARRKDRLEKLARALDTEVETAVVDVRDRDAVRAAVEALHDGGGVPDILVNNAGLAAGMDKLHEGDYDHWDRMIDTNVKGLLNVTREVLPLMVERDSGHVIHIGSIAGRHVYPKGAVYNATKFAVRALSEGMNLDLVGTRVRVSSVDPGMVETEFSLVRFDGDAERAASIYAGTEPLTAGDVADAVVYVAGTPPHVNIASLMILPTAQRGPTVIHREKG